ncbi:hypothetical protein ACOYW6_02355 [Parablastomonas sp. CN1-191]|uniref:hypothetical protein n=1 Tax=Parablastomonas sp. CN1-191 TaxID=3400908 RepID=UPI003BF87AE5
MHGDRAAAAVRDISPFGARLSIDADWLREGTFVELIGAGGARARAIVRWRRGPGCGVEFLVPQANPRDLVR